MHVGPMIMEHKWMVPQLVKSHSLTFVGPNISRALLAPEEIVVHQYYLNIHQFRLLL